MVELHVQRTIAAAPERVFDYLADPASLKATPLVRRAAWAAGSTPGVGAVREVSGIGIRFREEITALDPPNSYSYLILRSFPVLDHDGGTLTFTPVAGGTHVDWVTTYRHPARVGGKLLELVSAPLLRSNFTAILEACAAALET